MGTRPTIVARLDLLSDQARVDIKIANRSDNRNGTQRSHPVWTRKDEENLVESLVDAVARNRPPMSADEADVFRLSAQLLKTRFRDAADFLDCAARQFYADAAIAPRTFPKVVADGLVYDVPRLRILLERRMADLHRG